jgi:hypothetical protein
MCNIDGAAVFICIKGYVYLSEREKLFCYTDTVYLTFSCSSECCCCDNPRIASSNSCSAKVPFYVVSAKECVFKLHRYVKYRGKFPSDISWLYFRLDAERYTMLRVSCKCQHVALLGLRINLFLNLKRISILWIRPWVWSHRIWCTNDVFTSCAVEVRVHPKILNWSDVKLKDLVLVLRFSQQRELRLWSPGLWYCVLL